MLAAGEAQRTHKQLSRNLVECSQGVSQVPLVKPCYEKYRCSRNAPLSCDQPQQTLQQVKEAKFCLECGFPVTLLPDKDEIRGSRGTYQVTGLLGSRGMGRLYSGIQLNTNEPVVIKEYLLPTRYFNEEESSQRKDIFIRVAGVSPADGKTQDFRLISPSEAIADSKRERCYLVTKGKLEEDSQTLRDYLKDKGAMTAPQVREVLNQALQTLQFLHTQKLHLPSGQVRQGLAHGNLSLDSLLILENNQEYFTIYLCDLAVCERLFEPPSAAQPSESKPEQDLVDLGLVAFYLWVGRPELDHKNDQQWPDSDRDLKRFLHRLIGLDTPFNSAEAARGALLQLPKPTHANISAAVVAPEPKEKGFRTPLTILGFLALLLVGAGIWYFLRRGSGAQEDDFRAFDRLLPSFSDVENVPSGDFIYTGENDGTWSFVLTTKPESERNLEELLRQPKQNVEAQFSYQPEFSSDVRTASKPRESVQKCKEEFEAKQTCKAYFAITSLVNNLKDDLYSKPIAYDGLLVFVANSKKDQNLPKALNGEISLEQLSQIYTGKITNWKQLGGPDLNVKPHAPTEPEAVRLFQKLVLKDDEQQIAEYEATVTKQPTVKTQQQIVTEFDARRAGIISFGILSKTWDQCAGYPLALVDGNKPASQALIRLNRQPINPSSVNLCDKNNRLDVQTVVTGSYPLSYPLVVVYPRDNRLPPAGLKFAELLTTRQGQCLLDKAGLVPLQPVTENNRTSNGCKSLP